MSTKSKNSKTHQEKEMIGKVMLVNRPKGLYRLYPTFKGHDYVLVETKETETKNEFLSKLFGSDVNGTKMEIVDTSHSISKDPIEFFKEIGYKLTH